jgi:hypothetical protein
MQNEVDKVIQHSINYFDSRIDDGISELILDCRLKGLYQARTLLSWNEYISRSRHYFLKN